MITSYLIIGKPGQLKGVVQVRLNTKVLLIICTVVKLTDGARGGPEDKTISSWPCNHNYRYLAILLSILLLSLSLISSNYNYSEGSHSTSSVTGLAVHFN